MTPLYTNLLISFMAPPNEDDQWRLMRALHAAESYGIEEAADEFAEKTVEGEWLDRVRDLSTEGFLLYGAPVDDSIFDIAYWVGRFFGCACGAITGPNGDRVVVVGRLHRAFALEATFAAIRKLVVRYRGLGAALREDPARRADMGHYTKAELDRRVLRRSLKLLVDARDAFNEEQRKEAKRRGRPSDPAELSGYAVDSDYEVASRICEDRRMAEHHYISVATIVSARMKVDVNIRAFAEAEG